jgi:uracil phosphoribosyltransferase
VPDTPHQPTQRHTPIPGVTVIDHPLIRVKLTIVRDRNSPSDQFRRELRELATLMTFEVARDFLTVERVIHTPLASYSGAALSRPVIIAPILRAGLSFVDGMLQVLSDASVGHIGMYRNEQTHRPESYYFKLPSHLATAEVLVVDPMLATGWSATGAITQLKENGAKHLRYVCLVSCPAGLEQLRSAHPDVPIFTAAIDPELNANAYIVPGLGDAGDRYFGTYSHPPS